MRGSFQDPAVVDYKYEHMTDWGRAMFVSPEIIVDGELITTDLIEINLGLRILLGSSYYKDWVSEETFVAHDPLVGNPVDQRHPWNQTTIPMPQKRDLANGNYSWVMKSTLVLAKDRRTPCPGYWRRRIGADVGDSPGKAG